MTKGVMSDLGPDLVNDMVCPECGDLMQIEGEQMTCPACGYAVELDELAEVEDLDEPAS